ncbi:ABC transporter ATP-binding protein [Microbaculum marinum]|uniref:ABC transporter ATP-binding protein n=1 Tax=Microbaculum marinum TaxID=1764581 RepID=A0AAW9S235_9HYPH
MALLSITNLQVRYGRILGTDDVSFDLAEGETLALIGSNGAGKSSTLKAILGMVSYPTGEIRLQDKNLKGLRPSAISRLGVGLSPEGRRVFPYLSVLENLRIGAYARTGSEFEERLEQIYAYFPRLKERSGQRAGLLSGGEQQMLAIGRALMPRPSLFLLDEPSLGLAPIVVEKIGEIIAEVQKSENLSVVLAEQNANWAMSIAPRAVILELGRVAAVGASANLRQDPRVRTAYLGV